MLLFGGYVPPCSALKQCAPVLVYSKLFKMSEEVVNSDSNVRNRHKSGVGSLKNYKKKLKSEGKAYKNTTTKLYQQRSLQKVGIEQIRIMTVIWLVVANEIFYEIGQKYLGSGHSYLSCDRGCTNRKTKG